MTAPLSLVLPIPVCWGFLPLPGPPFLVRLRGPVVAHWVQGPLSVDEHRWRTAGAPGLAPQVPNPLCALGAPPNASGAQVVAHWVLQGPGLALWVPHPLRTLTLSRNPSVALLAHWESSLPPDPPVGSLGLLDGHCCAKWCKSTLGRAGGTMGGVGGGLGAPGWVAGLGVGCGLGDPCHPFPPHGWSAPGGPPLLLRKQHIWAAGDTLT